MALGTLRPRTAPRMRLGDRLRSATGAFAHRVRAALTVLGVVIGTSSIVLLASLLHGGEHTLVETNQETSNEDVIEVHGEDPPPRQRYRTTRALTRADAEALARDATLDGAHVEAESSFDAWARYEGRRKRVALVSSGPATMSLYRLQMARGRALDGDDRIAGRRVCVVGHEVYEELLHGAALTSALRLEIDGELFAIVGVLAEKPMIGQTTSTYLWDRKVMIPSTTYDALYAPTHQVERIYVRPRGEHAALRGPVRTSVVRVLLSRHLGVTNFELQKDESGGKEKLILGVIQVLLLGTGVLAVLASGINIMNVMLVTVSERRREIGLRRALGATRESILLQFLLEATALSVVGALVGIGAGIALSWSTAMLARSAIGAWDFTIPPWSLVLGLALALVTGLGFGLLPAWRAANVAPIDALRSE
jgi:putative ABC transport system permease protein